MVLNRVLHKGLFECTRMETRRQLDDLLTSKCGLSDFISISCFACQDIDLNSVSTINRIPILAALLHVFLF